MNMVIISGLSGSGKSVALRALEDMDFYCVDNLPIALLSGFADEVQDHVQTSGSNVGVGIDARNHPDQLNSFQNIISDLKVRGISCKILFLQADSATLLQRFSETRRKHPLSGADLPLADAIEKERTLLASIASSADMFIDTSNTNVHQLRDLIMESQGKSNTAGFSLLLRSFGYKYGIPPDADFVFDARCLPNPHWLPELRSLTGLDKEVTNYLAQDTVVQEYYRHLEKFLTDWIPRFEADNRSYLNIAIGCTGGQHRSVYLIERLAQHLGAHRADIVKRHRELE